MKLAGVQYNYRAGGPPLAQPQKCPILRAFAKGGRPQKPALFLPLSLPVRPNRIAGCSMSTLPTRPILNPPPSSQSLCRPLPGLHPARCPSYRQDRAAEGIVCQSVNRLSTKSAPALRGIIPQKRTMILAGLLDGTRAWHSAHPSQEQACHLSAQIPGKNAI